ncbi:MAG: SDR family oxidoreductase [Pegethrix bostrychoides GSE-TBD4-15B]|uniref:SDR family oxidoreductase n=1 Tax=Pegethrix bostrychoides GSE-TBD4-15B TaxID=2839662 RepID=A0A951PA83_9CYAN|nr:SDR family oxidoreductase [Pegethrix bostrychoides GSE-TBD4-15B]
MSDLQQPIALVTGANRGIGLEVVRQLAQQGMTVVLGSRDLTKGQAAAELLSGEGLTVLPQALDVTDAQSIQQVADWVEQEFGYLNVLVNNAGILYDTWQTASTADLTVVQEVFDTNTLGAWRMAQAFLPLIQRAEWGRIVNVSSEAGSLFSMSGMPAYSTSKAALNALTRLLAAELSGTNILVNSVCPGWVATDMGGAGGRPVEDGAASVIWAATLPATGATGGFFRDGKPLPW